jgi:AraC-like DNA-binding protein
MVYESEQGATKGARNIAIFATVPMGGYVSGHSWLVCCPGPSLMTMVVWGNPSREDALEVISTFRTDLTLGPHAYFIDARRMGANPDPATFAAVVEGVPNWDQYRAHIVRCAVLLPPGMAGAVVVGFFGMAPPPFDTRFFTDPIAALEWAGAPEPRRLLLALEELQLDCAQVPVLLQRLRSRLDEESATPNIASVARMLGMSIRLLQRRLFDKGTTYRFELNAARLRKAQRLLAGTDMKITAVALEVGCASSQHLSALFKRMTGESPSSWRAAHHAPSAEAARRSG